MIRENLSFFSFLGFLGFLAVAFGKPFSQGETLRERVTLVPTLEYSRLATLSLTLRYRSRLCRETPFALGFSQGEKFAAVGRPSLQLLSSSSADSPLRVYV